ncbi:hypothetical protein IFU00_04015 [Oxalobacteraceae sp. CFBP 8761]|nr:hypothetical protein [Oxalobacteraceae sp. CFBP 8761]
MNWYKKDTRLNLLLAYGINQGQVFAELIKNSLFSSDFRVNLISSEEATGFSPLSRQKVICTDLESALSFSKLKNTSYVFFQSPYLTIKNSGVEIDEQKRMYIDVHNILSKATRVISLTEKCRLDTQLHHSKHIYLSQIPSTFSDAISKLTLEGVGVIASDDELVDHEELLSYLRIFSPILYVTPSQTLHANSAVGMRLSTINPVPARPKIQIYLGGDRSDCTPLRIIDASAAGSVVIQIAYDGVAKNGGRWMPTDCIGYFSLDKRNPEFNELDAFIAHLLSNPMFFESILSAQRRYLPNFETNRMAFLELLTK